MRHTFFPVFVACLIGGVVPALGTQITLEFCQFRPADISWKISADTKVTYEFEVDRSGEPRAIRKGESGPTVGQFVPEKDVHHCIGRWRFAGIEETARLTVTFVWTHGMGWSALDVNGGDVRLHIVLSGDRCLYRPNHAPSP